MEGSAPFNPPSFAGFLELLSRQKFQIGVDHHLRLHCLLEIIGREGEVSDLKTILCPIFATSMKQQRAFYETFENYFEAPLTQTLVVPEQDRRQEESPARREDSPAETKHDVKRRPKWPYVTAVVVIFVLSVALAWWVLEPRPVVPSPQPSSAPFTSQRQLQSHPPPAQQAVQKHPEFQRILRALRWAIVPVPLLLLGIYLLRHHQRRMFTAKTTENRKPPYKCQFDLEETAPALLESESFYFTARLMRQRQAAESRRIDVESTISATIQAAGFPTLQYKAGTRPPEYLMLVDSTSPRDHAGRWFNLLARRLQDEGVYLVQYFFNQEPWSCWSADGTERFDLEELNKRYGNHRLLLLGDCDALLDPISGRPIDSASIFLNWHERAVLTPEPPVQWSWREFTLADSFAVLPATLEGLAALIDHFDALATPELRFWRGDAEPALAPRWDHPGAVFYLSTYLGEAAFRWLCACALYPELQWGLTLRLGSLPFVQQASISEENLLKLFRLPWMRVGIIPDDWRSVLISQLDDATQNQVREALVAMLESGLKHRNEVPADSWAQDTWRFQLAAQQGWLARGDPKRFREIMESLAGWPRKRLLRDVTVVGLLERISGLRLVLPYRLRRALYVEGMPALGLNVVAATLLALSTTAVLVAALFTAHQKPQTQPVTQAKGQQQAAPPPSNINSNIAGQPSSGPRQNSQAGPLQPKPRNTKLGASSTIDLLADLERTQKLQQQSSQPEQSSAQASQQPAPAPPGILTATPNGSGQPSSSASQSSGSPPAAPTGLITIVDGQPSADSLRAAENGDTDVMNSLGAAYLNGNGVEQDYRQALAWFRKAADAGNGNAMTNLGEMYFNGEGVQMDYRQASQWWMQAVKVGNTKALTDLGNMYANGSGVPQDYRQALTYFREGVKAGDPAAMTGVGMMYEKGLGVPKDTQQALMWFRRAAQLGDATAIKELKTLGPEVK